MVLLIDEGQKHNTSIPKGVLNNQDFDSKENIRSLKLRRVQEYETQGWKLNSQDKQLTNNLKEDSTIKPLNQRKTRHFFVHVFVGENETIRK